MSDEPLLRARRPLAAVVALAGLGGAVWLYREARIAHVYHGNLPVLAGALFVAGISAAILPEAWLPSDRRTLGHFVVGLVGVGVGFAFRAWLLR